MGRKSCTECSVRSEKGGPLVIRVVVYQADQTVKGCGGMSGRAIRGGKEK